MLLRAAVKRCRAFEREGKDSLEGHKPFSPVAAAGSPQPFLAAAAGVEQHAQPGRGHSSGSSWLREFLSFFVLLFM